MMATTKEKKRIRSLDFARGLALIFVIFIHILDQLSSSAAQETPLAWGIYVLGHLISAVVFMFLMGVSLSFSRHDSLQKGILRGLKIIAISYLLNVFRGTLPMWVALKTNLLIWEDIQPFTPLYLFKEVDILQFAGLALIILALIRHFFPKPWTWLFFASGILVLTPLVRGLTSGVTGLDLFLDLLWGTNSYVHFALFPWLVYPLMGMMYGYMVKKTESKNVFFLRSALGGILIMVLFIPFMLINPDYDSLVLHSTFYVFRNTSLGTLWYIGFVFFWMAVCYWFIKKIPENRIFNLLYYWSKNVTSFYCIQWIIIGWLAIFLYEVSLPVALIAMPIIIVATHYLIVLWNRYKAFLNRKKTQAQTPREAYKEA